MRTNPDPGPRKVADLTEGHPLEGRPFCLWRCTVCEGYFAARRPFSLLDDPCIVGLYIPPSEPDYVENRRLNRGRRKWAAAIDRGQLCGCEANASWETRDDLHVLLPENPEQWRESRHLGFPWE